MNYDFETSKTVFKSKDTISVWMNKKQAREAAIDLLIRSENAEDDKQVYVSFFGDLSGAGPETNQ